MKTSGNKQYTIKYLKHVLKRNLPSLPEDVKPSIKDAIKKYLETDPIGNGVLLRKRFKEHRRIKVADDYRYCLPCKYCKTYSNYCFNRTQGQYLQAGNIGPTETLNIFLYTTPFFIEKLKKMLYNY